MSKGSAIVPVRIPKELLAEIACAINSANATTAGPPYSVSSWVRKAIREKLDHLGRRGKSRKTIRQLTEIMESETSEAAMETIGVFLGEADTPGLATRGNNSTQAGDRGPLPQEGQD